jgi:hypothetical protein
MVNAISNAIPTQSVAQSQGTSPQRTPQPQTQPSASTDSVHLSLAAQAMMAAVQEARETPAQTTQEASHGDLQARRLLAKEAAAEPAAR